MRNNLKHTTKQLFDQRKEKKNTSGFLKDCQLTTQKEKRKRRDEKIQAIIMDMA